MSVERIIYGTSSGPPRADDVVVFLLRAGYARPDVYDWSAGPADAELVGERDLRSLRDYQIVGERGGDRYAVNVVSDALTSNTFEEDVLLDALERLAELEERSDVHLPPLDAAEYRWYFRIHSGPKGSMADETERWVLQDFGSFLSFEGTGLFDKDRMLLLIVN